MKKATKKATRKNARQIVKKGVGKLGNTPLITSDDAPAMAELSGDDEMFVGFILDGLSGTQAYLKVHPKVTAASAATLGHRLLRKVNIAEAIEEGRNLLRTEATMSRQEKREILAGIARGKVKDTKASDRNQAIKIDNQMTGDEAPIRVEGELTIGKMLKGVKSSTGLAGR